MRPIRGLMCCFGLVLALAPLAAFADTSADHKQAELANAEAQLLLAQQTATDFSDQATLSAANEREIAFLKSEALRQAQLNNAANANALQQMAATLASALRAQGDMNARNDIAILQIKANALIVKADANLANAVAIGRADEIANAQAQSAAWHQLADYLTGTLTQQNVSNDQVMANEDAAAVETSMVAEAENDQAMGANELFAADMALNGAQLAVESATISGQSRGEAVLDHAEASLANAEAMAAETP